VELIEALLELEVAAAVVESLLPDELTPEQQMELLDAWGPPARGSNNTRSRELQAQDWIGWIRSCAWRYEARPCEPSADELHRLIVRWVCASKRPRRWVSTCGCN
jgi:hypothetical protein